MAAAPDVTPFSAVIRSASAEHHAEAENSPFMHGMLRGCLSRAAFVRYTEQLWFVYRALEAPADRLAADPVAGPFIDARLFRLTALREDLDHLHGGTDWRSTVRPLPATETYAARISEVAAAWPAGYVAHHYTRYLGDLAGGQVIRSTAERLWGLPRRGAGVRFYVFDEIGSPSVFRRTYRRLLDELPVDDLEKQRVVEECQRAFAMNTAVFRQLGREFPVPA